MDSEGTVLKTAALWVARAALFLVPFTALIVANNMFFPFITGKGFFFRIVVEIGFAALVVLAIMDRRYRPRWSWISVALVAFVVWLFIADLFAVNPQKAFWSNFERMEGWITFIHLLMFFIVASTVLKVDRLWRAWWYTSLGIAVLVGLYGTAQFGCHHSWFTSGGAICQNWGTIHQSGARLDASLGNAAYLAVYMLFHVFIAGWLAFTTRRRWLKYTLLALAVFFSFILFETATRGTILGLGGGLFLAALLAAFTMGKRGRAWGTGVAVLLLLLGGIFWALKDTNAVRHHPVLGRIVSISLAAGDTRFTIWHMALEGFAESPKTVFLGWGQEGFNYVFNKYYDPSLYTQEQWFDRAHDAFLDFLVQGGLPAFLLYLSLFASVLWMLWRAPLPRAEQIALTALLAGYAFHNLFVFDNITSYILFIAVLAFVDSATGRPIPFFEKLPEGRSPGVAASSMVAAAAVAALVIATVDVPGMRAATGLIQIFNTEAALSSLTPGSVPQSVVQKTSKKLLEEVQYEYAHPAFAAQEVREQILLIAESMVRNPVMPTADKEKLASLAITQMQKEVKEVPLDARLRLELAVGYASFGDTKDALAQIAVARTLSPKKETIILEEGFIKLQAGDIAGANKDFQEAYKLAPQFSGLATYAAAGDVFAGNLAQAQALLKKSFGTTTVDQPILLRAYAQTKQYGPLIAVLKERFAQNPDATTTAFQLAVTYAQDKQPARGIAVIRAFDAAHPAAASIGDQIIHAIQQGKVP